MLSVGIIIKPKIAFHTEGGIRLWNENRTKSFHWFEPDEIGIILEYELNKPYTKVLTSSGNVGWVITGLLIPI